NGEKRFGRDRREGLHADCRSREDCDRRARNHGRQPQAGGAIPEREERHPGLVRRASDESDGRRGQSAVGAGSLKKGVGLTERLWSSPVGHKRGWTREDLYERGFLKRLEAGRHTTEEEHPMLQVGDKAP